MKKIATVKNGNTDEMRVIYKYTGATAPVLMEGTDRMMLYCEDSLELFTWACGVLGWDFYSSAINFPNSNNWLDADDLLDLCLDYEVEE